MELQTAVEDYIARKRLMGFRYRSNSYELRSLVRFLPSVSLDQIRVVQLEKFLNRPTVGRDTWIGRYARFKAFFSYWRGRGELRRIPLPRSRRGRRYIFSPYILTPVQIKSLLEHASVLDHCLTAIPPDTFRCLIITLYATGMWLDEALSLKRCDFDSEERTLHLNSRVSMVREIPLGRDLVRLLEYHLRASVTSELIFSTKIGTRIGPHRAGICFRRCMKRAGIRREDGARRRQPGLRDMRHAFAVNRITEWERLGSNMDLMLPRLSVYMGLTTFATTERYLPLAPTHFREQTRILSSEKV
jgi:integrase/recombinase XerD